MTMRVTMKDDDEDEDEGDDGDEDESRRASNGWMAAAAPAADEWMIPFIQPHWKRLDLVAYCRRLPRLRTTQPDKKSAGRRLPRLRRTAVGYPARVASPPRG